MPKKDPTAFDGAVRMVRIQFAQVDCEASGVGRAVSSEPESVSNSGSLFGCSCCLCRPSGTRINCSSGRRGSSQFMKPIRAFYIITQLVLKSLQFFFLLFFSFVSSYTLRKSFTNNNNVNEKTGFAKQKKTKKQKGKLGQWEICAALFV